jgi:hypothetical protein
LGLDEWKSGWLRQPGLSQLAGNYFWSAKVTCISFLRARQQADQLQAPDLLGSKADNLAQQIGVRRLYQKGAHTHRAMVCR